MEDRQVSLKQVLDTVDEMPVIKDNNGMEFIEKSLAKTRIWMLQSELNEWCTDCKEYDQERHCCPRWNRVIRQTVEEYKAAQPSFSQPHENDHIADDSKMVAQPEPCEDAVSREDVINFLCDWICAPGVRCNESSDKCGCIRGIKALPSAQPEIIHCGDCRYWKNYHLCECLSRYGTFETDIYFYCGFAKRREE